MTKIERLLIIWVPNTWVRVKHRLVNISGLFYTMIAKTNSDAAERKSELRL